MRSDPYVRSERAFFYVFLCVGGAPGAALHFASENIAEIARGASVVYAAEKPVLTHTRKAYALYAEQIDQFSVFRFIVAYAVAILARAYAYALAVAGARLFVFGEVGARRIVLKGHRQGAPRTYIESYEKGQEQWDDE